MRRRLPWLAAGPIAFAVVLAASRGLGLETAPAVVLATTCWMALWWVTEALPLAVTALLPLVLFPASGTVPAAEAAAPYADQVIYLFLGGFIIAAAVEETGLHKRIALGIVAAAGSEPRRTVLGFMVAAAALSMWISNTATAIMLLPVALAVASQNGGAFPDEETSARFKKALLLGVAYGASIGGVGTLVGSPPNLVFAGSAERLLGRTIDFAGWLAVGLPLVAILLPIGWLYLVRLAFPLPERGGGSDRSVVREELRALGPAAFREKAVTAVFALTAFCWIFRATKELGPVTVPGLDLLLPGLRDSTIAMAGAILLFVIPADGSLKRPILTWKVAPRLPWGILILFGGGLSLASAFGSSGLAEHVAGWVAARSTLGLVSTVALVVAVTVALTEVTSNTATAAVLMPLLAAAAQAGGHDPFLFMVPAAVACSFAFCLPVATPPNAVVFSSGEVTIGEMARAGLAMNVVAYLAWLAAFFLVTAPALGLAR